MINNYIIKNLAVLSILLNTVSGGNYRQTFSSKIGYECLKSKPKKKYLFFEKIINKIFWFDEDHCKHSYRSDVRYIKVINTRL